MVGLTCPFRHRLPGVSLLTIVARATVQRVATVVLIRHARSSANATNVLAGRTPGVGLDDTGRQQALDLAKRLADVPLAAVVSSPLDRCLATAAPLVADRPGARRSSPTTGWPSATTANGPGRS